ncbi:LamG-like jellyroll fold domain-containing protein [Streptacidiphilus sp. N1-10]|uniref:LamG-like jellyroll fold domain-containing protein n=1 Tax=Streptacidiphilus jeojiensis TaxID=3229225 RepID=A0ABV6XK80_9ACTN
MATKSGAQFDYYENADGSVTKRVSQTRINYLDSSGGWQPIDTSVAKGSDGRWHEKSNALGVSFAASVSSGTRTSASSATGSGSVRSAVATSALPWKVTQAAALSDSTVTSGSSSGELATLDISGSESVAWSLAGANEVTSSASGSSVEYDGILTDTNLVLQPTTDGVKESLVLTAADAPTTWVFPMSLKGLTLTTASDGTVELVDAAGAVAATLPQPFARDSSVDPLTGEAHEDWAMSYSVTEVDGSPAIELSLDPSWLADSSLQFPVTVDPTMTVSIAGKTDTTYVYYPNTYDYSSDTMLRVGTPDGGSYIAQTFMKFPSLPDTDGYHITDADLHLFDIWAYTCSTSTTYRVYPISESWSVTGSKSWSDRPDTADSIGSWSGTASSSVCANTSVSTSVGEWQDTDLDTTYFQDIALGSTTNYGLSVFSSATSSYQWKKFASSQVSDHSPYMTLTYAKNVAPDIEHTYPKSGFSSPSLTPQLQAKAVDPDTWPNSALKYDFALYSSAGTQLDTSGWQSSAKWTVPSGDLSWSTSYYWKVSTYDGWSTTVSGQQALGTQVAQPLVASRLAQNGGHGYDEEAGNYTTSVTDAKVTTVGPSLAVTRAYNSLDARSGAAFGAGWSSIADMRAVMDADGSKNVVVTDDGGQELRYGYSSAGYTPPSGTYATLKALSSGYALTETSGTTYTFATAGGTNIWLLSKITTHAGLSETFGYNSSYQLTQVTNSSSGRSLSFTWSTPSGAAHAHVATVTTDDATSGSTSTAVLWSYGYTGDKLTKVCPPSESASATASSSCYSYSYSAGSNYPAAVLDADPAGYWRLDEASGTSTAASSVLANEQTDAGSYKNTTLGGSTGPLVGSSATAATFAGTGYVKVPAAPLHASTSRAVSLWFKTSSEGVLIGDQSASVTGATAASGTWTPVLYVGSDGKLHGHWWSVSGSGSADFGSTSTVTDSVWHHAVLSSNGSTQTLYLDGVKQDTFSGTPDDQSNVYTYVGAGFADAWIDSPGDVSYFTGSISDVSFYSAPLTSSQVSDLYTAGSSSAAFMTKATSPAGRTTAQVSYDTAADRLTSVTDADGGTYTLGSPTVAGSSAVFHGAVLGADPTGYWQLGDDSSATYAADEVNGGEGTYNDATLGVTGPFSAKDSTASTAASFGGSDSYVSVDASMLHASTDRAVSLWFKTSTSGVLIGDQSVAIDGTTAASGTWTPVLYVGSDGKLHGHWWSVSGSGSADFGSTSTVTDSVWHHAVLSSNGSTQTLYLDGVKQDTFSGTPDDQSNALTYIGAGYAKSWIDSPGDVSYFTGRIAEVAFYSHALTATQVTAQWQAYKQSSGTVATETVDVTDPGGNTLSSVYDLSDSGRILSQSDGTGGTTSYGYDMAGFVYTTTDPNGNVTTTGHNSRGDVVSRTTCQDLSASLCSTSYYTYYLDSDSDTDPRNDKLLTSSDGRSSSSSDTTYRTVDTYDTNGNLLTATTPAVTGHSAGLTTTRAYTTASTAGYVSGTTVPAGLLASVTTPGGAVTGYLYYADGDLAQTTSPLGLITRYTYDGLGRVLTETEVSDTYPGGLVTTYSYDPLGRTMSETDPSTTDAVTGTVHTARTSYSYDADGNTLTTTVADTTGSDSSRTTTDTYNGQGELATTTDPIGYETSYSYDAFGNRTGESDANGQEYAYTYDGDGDLLTTTLTNYTGSSATTQTAAGKLLETRTYDAAGQLSTVTDAIGVTTSHAYYDNGLTKQVTETGSSGSSYVDAADSYDDAGNLIEKTTKNGTLTTDYTLDAADRTTAVAVDPSGADQVTAYTFDADSHPLTSTQTDTAGDTAQKWTYTYDVAGDRLTAVHALSSSSGLTTKWGYDERGLKTSMTNPHGSVYTYSNDEAGQLTSTIAPQVTTTTPGTGATTAVYPTTLEGYDTFGDRTEAEDALGDITATAYDADGRKTGTTLPTYNGTSATTAWTYDADGNTLTETDAEGNETDYSYDQLDDMVEKTNPAISIAGTATQGTWTYSYDLAGDQLTQTSPYGSVTHTGYDDLGRTSSTWAYVYTSTSATSKLLTTSTYNTAGEVAKTASASGVSATYTYDALGQTLTEADTTGDTTHYSYDLLGDVTKTVLPDSSIQAATYDAAGRMTATAKESAGGTVLSSTSATYSANGYLTSSTDELGNTTTFGYDVLGELTSQVEPVDATTSITTKYGYDADGNQTAYKDGNLAWTYYTYNSLGLQASKEVPAVTGYTSTADRTTSYTYDSLVELTTQTQPGGVTLTNSYDALGDLTSESPGGADATTATRTFDYSLNQHLVASATGSTWEYYNTNALGDLLTETGQAGSSGFTYNADQSPLTRTDSSGTSSYTYDTDGRLATDTDASTGTTASYAYNSLSQTSTISYGASGDVRSYTYDAQHRETSDRLATSAGTAIASINYGWDLDSNLTSKTSTGLDGASANTYTYDDAGRLTSWNNGTTTTAYTYDADGNRLTSGSTSSTYNARDQLTSDGSSTYSYTARGTLAGKTDTVTQGTEAYAFDAYGQEATAGATSYTYDALGRVITAGATSLTYSGQDNTVASDGTTTYSRDATGALTGETGTSGATLAWTDLHTDLVAQFTATATTLTGSATYDPWGNSTASTLTGNLGYQSEYTDAATGDVNMLARWYTPGTGTFDSADTVDNSPVGNSASANAYAYTDDSPLTGTDPTGHYASEGGGGGGETIAVGEFGDISIDWGGEGEGEEGETAAEVAEVDEASEEETSNEEQLEEARRESGTRLTSGNKTKTRSKSSTGSDESTNFPRHYTSSTSSASSRHHGSTRHSSRASAAAQAAADAAARAAAERAAAARAAARRAAIRTHAKHLTASIGKSSLTVRTGGRGAATPTATVNASEDDADPASDTQLDSDTVGQTACSGALLGFQCTAEGNLLDPETGTVYCNPSGAGAGYCVPLGAASDLETAVLADDTYGPTATDVIERAKNYHDADGKYLYRGVTNPHPLRGLALEGISQPKGGHSDPMAHQMGDMNSEFTSWTPDLETAQEFAKDGDLYDQDLLILRKPFSDFSPSRMSVAGQMGLEELEILVKGTVSGCEISCNYGPFGQPQ